MIPLGWREPLMEKFFEKSKQNTFKTLAVSNLSLSFHQLILGTFSIFHDLVQGISRDFGDTANRHVISMDL